MLPGHLHLAAFEWISNPIALPRSSLHSVDGTSTWSGLSCMQALEGLQGFPRYGIVCRCTLQVLATPVTTHQHLATCIPLHRQQAEVVLHDTMLLLLREVPDDQMLLHGIWQLCHSLNGNSRHTFPRICR